MGWILIDDGWQKCSSDNWLLKKQTGFLQHEKFGSSIDTIAKFLNDKNCFLLVWHALHGYWGGINNTEMKNDYDMYIAKPHCPLSLSEVCPESELKIWMDNDYNVPKNSQMWWNYYNDFYDTLSKNGVAGIKCDGFFISETFCGSHDSRNLREIQQMVAKKYFGNDAPNITCMGMTLPAVQWNNCSNKIMRVSDDHIYPNCDETDDNLVKHIWHSAVNSLWLNSYVHCDWDMFSSNNWCSGIHAVSRAVSGGPIYISDPADRICVEILEPLLLPKHYSVKTRGIIPCMGTGYPINKHVFLDPTINNIAWCIENITMGGWIVASFGFAKSKHQHCVTRLFPSDLRRHPNFKSNIDLACMTVSIDGMCHANILNERYGWDIKLKYLEYQVLSIVPLFAINLTKIAVFGFGGVWNPFGSFSSAPVLSDDMIIVNMLAKGNLLMWVDTECTVTVFDNNNNVLNTINPTSNKIIASEVNFGINFIKIRDRSCIF